MERNKAQTKRLKRLYAIGCMIVQDKLEFGFHSYNEEDSCDTPACFLGWYCRLEENILNKCCGHYDRRLLKYFGITVEESISLFSEPWYVQAAKKSEVEQHRYLRDYYSSKSDEYNTPEAFKELKKRLKYLRGLIWEE